MLTTPFLHLLTLLSIIQHVFSATPLYATNSTHPRNQTVSGQSFPALIEVTTEDLQQGLKQNLFTSQDLVKAYLARISEVNGTLHVVTEVNPDALAIARDLDAERKAGKVRGPLHGMPILIKGNIATHDKLNTTAGSFALLGARVPRDSTIARKLRAAGAIILGKTNLSQWANFRSDNTSNGWSAYGGQTKGVYFPDQDPSGSSSGSGVAAAIGLSLATLGSETDGSIVSPAENSNLAAIKPTVGLTSRYLVVPISEHQDTVGPMARSVKDAAYLLQAIAGRDPKDNYTSLAPAKLPDYVGACNLDSLRGARIGVPRNVIERFSDNTTRPLNLAFNKALKTLTSAGATIVDANFTALDEFLASNNETIVLEADFISNLYTYLSELTYNPTNVTSLRDIVRFTRNFKQEAFPKRDINVWQDSLDLGFNNSSPELWQAYQYNQYLGGPGGLLGAIERHGLDAVVLPTSFSSSFAAITGSPIVTVPLGFYPQDTEVTMNGFGNLVASSPNFPFGLAFLGNHFSEPSLIGYAYAFEQRTKVRERVQPYIVPNIELRSSVAS